jgi:hypothetical protein
MASNNLSAYKADALAGGGIRANLFQVSGAIGAISNERDLAFMVKSASMPAASVGEIIVPYRGRQIKLPGDRVFEDWEITVMSDSNMSLRKSFEEWHNQMQTHEGNTVAFSNNLFADWSIQALDRKHKAIANAKYTMFQCWPKALGAMEMAFDTNDTIVEFTVTMSYQYWENEKLSGKHRSDTGG